MNKKQWYALAVIFGIFCATCLIDLLLIKGNLHIKTRWDWLKEKMAALKGRIGT